MLPIKLCISIARVHVVRVIKREFRLVYKRRDMEAAAAAKTMSDCLFLPRDPFNRIEMMVCTVAVLLWLLPGAHASSDIRYRQRTFERRSPANIFLLANIFIADEPITIG